MKIRPSGGGLTANSHSTRSRFARGFDSLEVETRVADLPIEGSVPAWLRGTLLRNGPAKFETSHRSLRHWFDGLAMVHRFAITNGRVSYANRFLDSAARKAIHDDQRIAYREFATDPCATHFGRFFSRFIAHPTDNPNVNIGKLAERMDEH